ncbi:MAG: class F sortase [Candidatus Saccharibacteria bacterium]|nr:class F sortase [Candidatus Saccharibacteria bacterium]
MTLKIDNWKKLTSRIFWGLLATLLLVFFLRVVIWEDQYYKGKVGTERATAVTSTTKDEEPLVEVEPTKKEIEEYNVPAENPRYLTIEKLGRFNARVIMVGTKGENNELAAPNNIFDVGWYEKSGKPGEGKTMILDGHRGGPNEPNGIFNKLETLATGEIIKIERGDGEIFQYKVVENKTYPSNSSDIMLDAKESPIEGEESISIITCVGGWDLKNQTYDARQLLRAVKI